jgi:hypothetical protein
MCVVYVEWRGEDLPSIIRHGKKLREQWLNPDSIRALNGDKSAPFEGELIEGIWYLGDRVEHAPMQRVSSSALPD